MSATNIKKILIFITLFFQIKVSDRVISEEFISEKFIIKEEIIIAREEFTSKKEEVISKKEEVISKKEIIIDANYTFQEAIAGTNAPDSIIKNLLLIDVEYYSFDKKLHRGQLVLHKDIAKDIQYIFKLVSEEKFPIDKVIPIVKYNWSDSLSMLDNNTSAFNYRKVSGSRHLSKHATGKAIDINPMQNPYRSKNGKISPATAKYNKNAAGTLTANHKIVLNLLNRNWIWGGNWKNIKDWQHFEKP